jgi:holliday junction DNA helicase RuvA
MIERLEGKLVHRGPTVVHLEAGPFQLELSVPLSTSQKLPEEGHPVQLWTHLLWREDGPVLFGFITRSERELFRLLLLVQGIGPRIALSVLSHLSPLAVTRQIRQRSVEGLTQVPGIGSKTAGRILVELGPRVDHLVLEDDQTAGAISGSKPVPGEEDAVLALTALGYPARDARKAVERILQESPSLSLDECIRRALRGISGSSTGA